MGPAGGSIIWTQIDSCVVWPNGKAYFFGGREFVSYDIANGHVDEDYPQPIAGNWPGLWSPCGAGVVWPNGKAYFFRGVEYLRYDITRNRVDDGYPKFISGNWPRLSLRRVDAAVVWPNGKAYLFGVMVGDIGQPAYVQYDIASDGQDDVPLLIETDWPGLSPAISAAVVWPNGKAYFFRGVEYLRYDIARQRFDDGYPKAIFSNWPGVPIASPATMPRRDH